MNRILFHVSRKWMESCWVFTGEPYGILIGTGYNPIPFSEEMTGFLLYLNIRILLNVNRKWTEGHGTAYWY